ncbi:6800_t:CDS:2 [Gigaspora margarita]|uniref:6800_t:CDS:1 n=1 Tax=Gigaspora margarita TaxID=4874 RepID=A0ABM8W3Z8_GIGMA|nr:6800_t:CDS:2 [Gigaspora margarita]
MVSHVSLLVVIISVKNSHLCSNGLAKYKLTKELSQIVKFKYFFSTDQPFQTFANSDIVFISGKYIVENMEPCFTITYSSIIDSGNPNCEFDMSNIPITISHYMYFVTVNCDPKRVKEFVHFGIEMIEYNSVTSKSNALILKYDPPILYLDILNFQSLFILNNANATSIIDIIDDDIDSTATKLIKKDFGLFKTLAKAVNTDVEIGPSHDKNKSHTAVKSNDESNEKQTDNENNEKPTNSTASKNSQDNEKQENNP